MTPGEWERWYHNIKLDCPHPSAPGTRVTATVNVKRYVMADGSDPTKAYWVESKPGRKRSPPAWWAMSRSST